MRSIVLALALLASVVGCVSIQEATPNLTPAQPSPTTTPPTNSPPTLMPTLTPTPVIASPSGPAPGSVAPTATPASPATAPPSAPPSGRPTFSSVDDAYHQTVDWHSCSVSGVPGACANVYVPTVYEQPDAGTTALAVARFPATGVAQGDLLTNPGGPGEPGIDFAAELASAALTLSSSYNFVGFDPRGTGQSDPLTCLDTQDLDALNAFDPTPDSPQEREQGIQLVDEQGAACQQNSGLLAAHVSTIEAARDMDVIRAVLGDDKLDYFGFSYGTFLGTTYAALFPDKVDRFVLDGALAPGLSAMQVAEIQNQGLETEFEAYISNCVKTESSCPVGESLSAGETTLRDLLVSVDSTPLPTGDPARPLTQALAFAGIIDAMYTPQSWPDLSTAVAAALAGNGAPLLAMSDQYYDRSNGRYVDNVAQANQAISCLDEEIAGGPTTASESKFLADSPIAGDIMYGFADRGCGDWPLKTSLTAPDYHAPGTPPIVVVGTTRDPATPLVWAQELAKTLDNGVLLTRDGDGHTAYLSGNPCIVSAVNTFLVEGTPPADGTRC